MKIRDIIKRIESDGWYIVETRGSIDNISIPKKQGV